MSVIDTNQQVRNWRHHGREAAVQLFLSGAEGNAADLTGAQVAGFPLALSLIDPSSEIAAADLAATPAAVIQVDAADQRSVDRFKTLAATTRTPLIAAAYDPPLAFVRALIRAGAHDVVPLPLDMAELESSLAPIRDEIAKRSQNLSTKNARLVSVIKSMGGVGATALLTQLATRFAQNEGRQGREACLIDFDVQFGDAAFYLGLRPSLTLTDLVEAGSRIDGELVRATTTAHSSGLKVVAAPAEMLPLEALTNEQVIDIVDHAKAEFSTVFVDLPANWTNWSLSLLARSDIVILVTELTVVSLNRARRQLELIASQDLAGLDVRVLVNRFEKGFFRTIKPADAEQALGRDIAFTVANDHATMSTAIDQGEPIETIRRKSPLVRDLDALDAGLCAALGRDR